MKTMIHSAGSGGTRGTGSLSVTCTHHRCTQVPTAAGLPGGFVSLASLHSVLLLISLSLRIPIILNCDCQPFEKTSATCLLRLRICFGSSRGQSLRKAQPTRSPIRLASVGVKPQLALHSHTQIPAGRPAGNRCHSRKECVSGDQRRKP